jgi:hypothetical protein
MNLVLFCQQTARCLFGQTCPAGFSIQAAVRLVLAVCWDIVTLNAGQFGDGQMAQF